MATSSPNPIGDTFQSSFYVGNSIQNVLYGMELLLYFKTIRTILSSGRARKKSDIFHAIFNTTMVLCTTVWVATQAHFGQEMWVLNPNFSGGPIEYWKVHVSDWYMDCGSTAVVLLQLITDALMIHRCRIVWNSYFVVVIPIILWLATFVLGILVDLTSSTPGGDFFTGIPCRLGIGYYSVSVFLHATLTSMICYRMLRHGWKIQEHVGREHTSLYFSLITTVIESVLPYTISGIAFLVALGLVSPTAVAFSSLYVLMMCISPQMLILRVIVGIAWKNDASEPAYSSIQFNHENTSGSRSLDDTQTSTRLRTPSKVYLPGGDDRV